LFAVEPDKAASLLHELTSNNLHAAEIGEFTSDASNKIEVIP